MFLFALAFLGGHCLVHLQPKLPPSGPALYLIFAISLVTAVLAAALAPLARKFAGAAASFILAVALAYFAADARMFERWPESLSGSDVELEGYVASLVAKTGDGQRFRFDVISANAQLPPHIELSSYDTQLVLQPGELWRLHVRLRSPRGFANPGGYDYEAQLLREDVGATGYLRDGAGNRRLREPAGYWILRMRAAIAAQIELTIPNAAMLGVVQGLTVGDTSRMSAEQWRVFGITGTTHLMAISGMHIGMVALWIAWLCGRVARRFPLQRLRFTTAGIQATVGIASAGAYSALAGLSVPTQRTLFMLCVFFMSRLLRRELSATRGLSIALIGVLLIDPFAPLAAGFWLSFGAVSALFLATYGGVMRESRLREYGRLQVVATIGLAPLVIGAFGTLSLASPFVNLIAIPFFTFLIVPLALIASALIFAWHWAGALVMHCAVQLLDGGWFVLLWASRLPFANVSLPELPAWTFALLLLGAALLIGPGVYATRCTGALLCIPALLWQPTRPNEGEFEIALLDVGQGLSLVVTTHAHVLTYDTGPSFRSGRDAGELVVGPYLRAKGDRRIDALVVSHGDADHAGGIPGLLARTPADRLLFGPSVASRPNSEVCAAGQNWRWEGVEFNVLYPPADSRLKRRNDSSCVLRIVGKGGSALLLGDIERGAEEWLVEHAVLERTDIVIVPHHGSKTSSTQGLVDATKPRYALISAGFQNQWGFPKHDVLARWENAGAATLQTMTTGAIELSVTKKGVAEPRAYRRDRRRYWRK